MGKNPWEIYDAMIAGIPAEKTVDEVICGYGSSFVRSGNAAGVSGFRNSETRGPMFSQNVIGIPLRQLAECVKSWNYIESSVGLSAINAWYNSVEAAAIHGIEIRTSQRSEDRMFDPFIMSQREARGKKVAVIGHFPHIDRLLDPICSLSVLDLDPEEGDFPYPAAEFLLPQCDLVFASNRSITDKTLPRILELSKNAQSFTIVGPGTPMAPVLFDYGVTSLSSFVVKDVERAARIVAGAERVKIFATGQKTNFSSDTRTAR